MDQSGGWKPKKQNPYLQHEGLLEADVYLLNGEVQGILDHQSQTDLLRNYVAASLGSTERTI